MLYSSIFCFLFTLGSSHTHDTQSGWVWTQNNNLWNIQIRSTRSVRKIEPVTLYAPPVAQSQHWPCSHICHTHSCHCHYHIPEKTWYHFEKNIILVMLRIEFGFNSVCIFFKNHSLRYLILLACYMCAGFHRVCAQGQKETSSMIEVDDLCLDESPKFRH